MDKLSLYAKLLKLEHTFFALPFLLSSVVILYQETPPFGKMFWLLVAFVAARTAGMAFNRWIDLPIDKANPRTSIWPHATGHVKEQEIRQIALVSSLVFVLSSLMINWLAFFLSPFVLFLLWFYPYAKRVTYYPHFVLGLVYFLIPVAVDVALNTRVSWTALVLGTAMALWVSGFDILYSLQDYDFDRQYGVKSLAVKYGIGKALKVARLLHIGTFLSLLLLVLLVDFFGFLYVVGLFFIALLLVYEHSLVKESDLSHLNRAFFTVNAWVSLLYFLVVLISKVTDL
ncbi:4-hydroxybenzoate polyprenyltransferase [Thermocrinis albus DSM 14484]|uniref:4-hydroxybenzoate polyprenyltransferase n=1 Tax=Thermocrinis albus (strain DSM 14484 / JCM 11386 / HI 11/12) TaxID=638303 RepID=D3SLK7_THEAH|nr:UbiA-like polyprenyltransferase [Thermocrinis albus]ADC89637.1 4-hydroxybenzoate polyprenyltransferase [Thermocrinis albus DSM 14484]